MKRQNRAVRRAEAVGGQARGVVKTGAQGKDGDQAGREDPHEQRQAKYDRALVPEIVLPLGVVCRGSPPHKPLHIGILT